MKKIILLLLFIPFVLATNWQAHPEDCPVEYNSVSCTGGELQCGIESPGPYCYDMTILLPLQNSTSNSGDMYDGSFSGGFILNCEETDSDEPYCDSSPPTGDFWCNRNQTCYAIEFRQTRCVNATWSNESGSSNCQGCRSDGGGYLDCDTDGTPCEIDVGGSCGSSTGTYASLCNVTGSGGSGNCTALGTNADCDDDDGDANNVTCNGVNGCEINIGTDTNNSNSLYISCNSFECASSYNDCNGLGDGTDADGCEIQDGSACAVGGATGEYLGCSCIVPRQLIWTGNLTEYYTLANETFIWLYDWGLGNRFIANGTNNKSVIIDNSGDLDLENNMTFKSVPTQITFEGSLGTKSTIFHGAVDSVVNSIEIDASGILKVISGIMVAFSPVGTNTVEHTSTRSLFRENILTEKNLTVGGILIVNQSDLIVGQNTFRVTNNGTNITVINGMYYVNNASVCLENGTNCMVGGSTGDIWVNDIGDKVTGLINITTNGVGLEVWNTNNASANIVAKFGTTNRSPATSQDNASLSFYLVDSDNNSIETNRLIWQANDITAGGMDTEFRLYSLMDGAWHDMFTAGFTSGGSGVIGFNQDKLDTNYNFRTDNNDFTMYIDGGQDRVQFGGTLLSTAFVSIDGIEDEIQLIVQGYSTQTSGDSMMVIEQSDGDNIFQFKHNGDLYQGVGEGDILHYFDGSATDGYYYWRDDEDYFEYNDGIKFNNDDGINFRDTEIGINSTEDGQLDIKADVSLQVDTPFSNFNEINSSNLTVDSININGNTITNTGTSNLIYNVQDLRKHEFRENNAIEVQIYEDFMMFNNGATQCTIGWQTNGQLDFLCDGSIQWSYDSNQRMLFNDGSNIDWSNAKNLVINATEQIKLQTDNVSLTGNMTLEYGGKIYSNLTCSFMASPNGGTVLSICN